MSFPAQSPIPFESPCTLAPNQVGCYGIQDAQGRMIYVGMSGCLKRRIEEHARGEDDADACIHSYLPTRVVTVVTATEASARQQEKALILYYQPMCNQKIG